MEAPVKNELMQNVTIFSKIVNNTLKPFKYALKDLGVAQNTRFFFLLYKEKQQHILNKIDFSE